MICSTIDYVLIHPSQSDEFISHVQNWWKEWYPGWPAGAQGPNFTRLVNQRYYNRILSLLGADRIPSGVDESDLFILPTILKVTIDDPLMAEEIFGPVITVLETETIDEGIQYVNSQPYPLAAYLFSTSEETRNHIIQHIRCGGITENDSGG